MCWFYFLIILYKNTLENIVFKSMYGVDQWAIPFFVRNPPPLCMMHGLGFLEKFAVSPNIRT